MTMFDNVLNKPVYNSGPVNMHRCYNMSDPKRRTPAQLCSERSKCIELSTGVAALPGPSLFIGRCGCYFWRFSNAPSVRCPVCGKYTPEKPVQGVMCEISDITAGGYRSWSVGRYEEPTSRRMVGAVWPAVRLYRKPWLQCKDISDWSILLYLRAMCTAGADSGPAYIEAVRREAMPAGICRRLAMRKLKQLEKRGLILVSGPFVRLRAPGALALEVRAERVLSTLL